MGERAELNAASGSTCARGQETRSHPDQFTVYKTAEVTLLTHDAGGLTERGTRLCP